MTVVQKASLTPEVTAQLIELSRLWMEENCSNGMVVNTAEDLREPLYVALDGDRLVGISLGSIMHWCTGTEYYIYEFCISRDRQHEGLGTELLRGIEERVKDMGVDHIFLQTEESAPAYSFYQKNGFTELKGHVSLVHKL